MASRFGILLAISGLLFPAIAALAGSVSLNPAEIEKLRILVKTNAKAAAHADSIREVAGQALLAAPAPINKVVSEGHLVTDPRKIATVAALQDLPKTEALAWMWALTREPQYLAKTREFLIAWAEVNEPDGDPINEAKFEPMIVAYDLTRDALPPAERQGVEAWLREKGEALIARKVPDNNWGGHAAKAVGLIGFAIKDTKLSGWAVAEFKRLIAIEMHPDGSTKDFYQRDAIHYQIGSVGPLLSLARASAREGIPLFDYTAPSGALLRTAVDFIRPFAEGTKTHVEFVNSTVQFDRSRAKSGEKEYSHHTWEPKSSIGLFCQAAWFDPAYGDLAAKIAGKPGDFYFNWQMVLNAVSTKTAPKSEAGVSSPSIVVPSPIVPPPMSTAMSPTRGASGKEPEAPVVKPMEGKFANPPTMKFIAVPIVGGPTDSAKSGITVLFSETPVTVAQYREFVLSGPVPRDWPKASFPQGDDHPAVKVSWTDAMDYCAWLTERERRAQRLGAEAKYRLPSDHEWSCTVGIGHQEDPNARPKTKNGLLVTYPWGPNWPPPAAVGNYADELSLDSYEHTSAVKTFPPNALGIYDLGGNVWKWCLDLFETNGHHPAKSYVLRGGSWGTGGEKYLRSSCRIFGGLDERNELNGFACVAEIPPVK